MSFPYIDAPKRTDESFRERSDPAHHKESTPFEELNIDMITSFPIADDLHLLHLGVTKKCMMRWINGEKKITTANGRKMLRKMCQNCS